MTTHVDTTTVCRADAEAIDTAYQQAVTKAVDALLAKEWEVREVKSAFRVVPHAWPDSAGAMAIVQKRDGRVEVNRKIADAIAMLPLIIRLLDEAVLCIGELLEQLPEGMSIPDRVTVFVGRMAAAAAAAEAEGGGR
jgi:hypothetical protein